MLSHSNMLLYTCSFFRCLIRSSDFPYSKQTPDGLLKSQLSHGLAHIKTWQVLISDYSSQKSPQILFKSFLMPLLLSYVIWKSQVSFVNPAFKIYLKSEVEAWSKLPSFLMVCYNFLTDLPDTSLSPFSLLSSKQSLWSIKAHVRSFHSSLQKSPLASHLTLWKSGLSSVAFSHHGLFIFLIPIEKCIYIGLCV